MDDVCVDKTVLWQSLPGHLGVTPSRGHSCTCKDGCAEDKTMMGKASPEVILLLSLMPSEFVWVAASKQ